MAGCPWRILILLGLWTVLASAARGGVNDKIIWGVPDWRPYSNPPESNDVPGSINILLKIITNNIKGFKSDFIESSVPKAMELWKQGKNICSPVALYTKERAALAYMTPIVVLPPLELVTRVSKKSLLVKDHKALDLAKLLEDKHWRGVFVSNRSYGDTVDMILSHEGSKARKVTAPHGDWLNILHMVGSGRADYSVEYPSVTKEYNKSHTAFEQLASIPIKGYRKTFQFMVACPRTPTGKMWIKAIDKALIESARKPNYRNYMEELFLPDDRIKFKKEIDEFVERRSRGSWFTSPMN